MSAAMTAIMAGLILLVAMLTVPAMAATPVRAAPALPSRIVVGVIVDEMMPIEGVKNGQLTGFSGDLLRQLLEGSGSRLQARSFPDRRSLLEAACKGDVDLVMSAVPRDEFQHCLHYSAPYLERSVVLVARQGDQRASDPGFLDNARVALEAGSPWTAEWRKDHHQANLTETATVTDALDKVVIGEADAYLGLTFSVNHLLEQPHYATLRGVRLLHPRWAGFHFGGPVRSNAILAEIDRQLARIPDVVLEKLRDRWLQNHGALAKGPFTVSAPERDVLQRRGMIRYTIVAPLPPYAFENGERQEVGITVDYITYLGKMLGVPVEFVRTRDLADAIQQAKAGTVDVIAGTSQQRGSPLVVTVGAYETAPMAIVAPASATLAPGLPSLAGKRLAIADDEPMSVAIRERLPDVVLVHVKSTRDALNAVSEHRADAMIGNLTTMDALIRSEYPGELRIVGPAGFQQDLVLMTAPGIAELVPAFKRAMVMMPELEKLRIRSRWQAANYRFDAPWGTIVRRIWPLLLLCAIAMFAVAFNYSRLRREIRRRRAAEQQLQCQLALKDALMESLPYPVVAKDSDQRYVEVNAAFEALVGMSKHRLIGRKADALDARQPEASLHVIDDLCEEAIATMTPRDAQLAFRDAAGQAHTMIYGVRPFRAGDGSAGGVIATLADITEIYEAQQRALLLERRLQDVTSSLPAIVYQMRRLRRTGAHAEFTYAAGNGDETMGLSPDDLLGDAQALDHFLHPDDRERVQAELDRSEETREPFDLECRLVGRHGIRWVNFRAVARRDENATLWSGVIADVTDQHTQAEALAKAKDAAEAALRAKESFLAMMSHEIRTPLNGVLGLVEVLQSTALTSEQQKMLALVVESGQALAQILDDVLDYAKIEAGRLAILPAPMDLRELSDSVLGLLAPQAHGKKLHLRVHIAAEVPATIHADAIRLRQILFNLLGNAIKFTDHGEVILRMEAAAVSDGEAELTITVSDTGIGISPDNLQRLFAPFVQSEPTSTRRYGGTGLGLSICKRLAGLMGGKLSMQSEPGEGTSVTLRLRCPVVHARYDLPTFHGKQVFLDISDAELAASVRAHAEAAGLVVLSTLPDKASRYSHLIDGDTPPPGVPSSRLVYVTRAPKQLGFRVLGDQVRLSQNPLRWGAFLGAIQASIGSQAAVAAAVTEPACTSTAALPVALHGRFTPPRILVAEDHPINRELIKQQLSLLGYRCTLCGDGQEALQTLHREHFDLVLTDCHMPVMDGFELTRAIRTNTDERLRALPVIGVTATTLAEEHQRCFDVGMNGCVLKPTTLASMQKAISRALSEPEHVATRVVASSRQASGLEEASGLNFDASKIHEQDFIQALGGAPWSDAMLSTCLSSIGSDRDALEASLRNSSISELRQWCHRAGGALAVFQHAYIDQLFDEFGVIVKQGDVGKIRAAGKTMLEMMSHVLNQLAVPRTA
ncbi:ATP-binding protein [Cupriavidus numazuensis]